MCAVTGGFVAFEQNAAHNRPYDWGVGASLSCTIDWEELAVGVELVGYSKDGLELVLSFFECSSMDKYDVAMESVAPSDEAS